MIAALMLLGNVGLVGAASTAILGFQGGAWGHAGWRVAELGVGLVAVVLLSRSHWVDRKLTDWTSRILRRPTDLEARDLAPPGTTVLDAGDNLILYGRAGRLRELDQRTKGAAGEQARTVAVREQEQIERQGAETEPET